MRSVVFNEDCEKVMHGFPDRYFDVAVCDIPYGLKVGKMAYLKETAKTVKQKNGNRLNAYRGGGRYVLKDWDKAVPSQSYYNELKRISKHQIIFGIDYVNWFGVGTGRIKWDKGVANGVSFKRYERAYCSVFDHEHEIKLLWSGMLQAKSLTESMVQQGNKKLNEKRIHPTQKPVLLYDAIYQILYENGLTGTLKVLDTHLGSGSNRISCRKLGHEFIGCEIDSEYYNDQEERFKMFDSQLRLFETN